VGGHRERFGKERIQGSSVKTRARDRAANEGDMDERDKVDQSMFGESLIFCKNTLLLLH